MQQIRINTIKTSIFSLNRNTVGTASYIFTRDKNGVYHFGLVRKLAPNERIRKGRNKNTGAAGTLEKYHGKWGGPGGGKDRHAKHELDAAIIEIRDEVHVPRLTYKHVQVKSVRRNSLLYLHHYFVTRTISCFLFEMKPKLFFRLFSTV